MLSDLTVALLADNGTSQSQLAALREELESASIAVHVVSPTTNEIAARDSNGGITRIHVDRTVPEAVTFDYAATVIPAGFPSVALYQNSVEVINFLKQQFSAGKIIGAINEGVLLLITADLLKEKKATSLPGLKSELTNAGSIWSDESVTTDNGIITCRCETEINSFTNELLGQLESGVQQRTETII